MVQPIINLKKLTLFSLLFTFMIVLHFIELFFVIPLGGYPLKIGLGNIIIVFVLFVYNDTSALLMVFLKILALMFFDPRYTAFTFLISASGSLLSILGMMLAKRFKSKILLTSLFGGLLHNVGQWLAVWAITQLTFLIYFLPFLVLSGSLSGLIIGWINNKTIRHLVFLKKHFDIK